MTRHHLCFARCWDGDDDLARLLGEALIARGLSLLEVTPEGLDGTLAGLDAGELGFGLLLDRASDADPRFLALAERARTLGVRRLNPREHAARSWNKALMHELLSTELRTPATLVLAPWDEEPDPPPLDLEQVGSPFCAKPAHGGGGDGVSLGLTTLDDLPALRREFPTDSYLVQAHVEPVRLGDRPAWFRNLYSCGRVYPCWWSLHDHRYVPVTAAEMSRFALEPLTAIMRTIARLSRMHLFSSEIALTEAGHFVVVDYLNDPVDLRLQSRAPEAVPDEIVAFVAADLAELAASGAPPR